MGYGAYSYDAHVALTQDREHKSVEKVFAQRGCHALMNPKGVKMRECRDSAEHPNSLGIVFALDVSGSMGKIPEVLAKHQLPKLMKILSDSGFSDAQVLFAALGNATADQAPLQVGQFETTAELMDQWLTWCYLEGGGGDNHESYELALYFLAEHTDMDCWNKRKKKGYVFMTGDEIPFPLVSRHQVDSLIGDKLDEDLPTAHVVAAVGETFHPFFLIPTQARRAVCEREWRDLMGDHVIAMDHPDDTCFVSASLVALTEGVVRDVDALAKMLEHAGAAKDRIGRIIQAVTPYAGQLGKDGAPLPAVASATSSGWKRARV